MGGEYEAGGRGLSSYAAGLVHTNDIIDGKKDEAERGGQSGKNLVFMY